MSSSPFFKSTFHSTILYYARYTPHAIAVAFGSQEVSYAEFARDIERATRRLAARLPARSGLAMLSVGHPYLHWVLTIALGRIGMCTVTAFDRAHTADLIRPDLVFADTQPALPDERFIAVDQDWIAPGADSLPPFADPAHLPDAPFRLLLSSGTTGTPKKVLLTHGLFQNRLQAILVGSSMTGAATRALILVGVDTVAGHALPLSVWSIGGRVVLLMPGEDPYRTIVGKGVNWVFLAPVQLEHLLHSMPPAAWPLPGLTLCTGGSSLPHLLSERVRARLSPSLVVMYGSTEVGLLSFCHAGLLDLMPGATGIVRPNVELQIVDPAGRVLPHGEVGEVRCRSIDGVSGYLDAQAGDADNEEAFRDGWFHPGDAGTLSSDGVLSIIGRSKDLMNLGGVKISPTQVEEVLSRCPGVADIAAFALEQDDAVATPWVAVVRGPNYDQAALASAFRQMFPRLPALRFAHADLIPRNRMGKIQRNLISEQVRRSLAGGA